MNAEMNTKINIKMNIKMNMNRIFFRILTVNMHMSNGMTVSNPREYRGNRLDCA